MITSFRAFLYSTLPAQGGVPETAATTAAAMIQQGGFAAVAAMGIAIGILGLWLYNRERSAREASTASTVASAQTVITNNVKFTNVARRTAQALEKLDGRLENVEDMVKEILEKLK